MSEFNSDGDISTTGQESVRRNGVVSRVNKSKCGMDAIKTRMISTFVSKTKPSASSIPICPNQDAEEAGVNSSVKLSEYVELL